MKKAPGFQTIGHSPNCNRPGFWAELSGESTERTRRRALASHFLAYRGQILNKLSSPTLPLFTEIYVKKIPEVGTKLAPRDPVILVDWELGAH